MADCHLKFALMVHLCMLSTCVPFLPFWGLFGAVARAPSVLHWRLKANMWTVLPDGVPTILIALTWILWRQIILQTAGAQSEPTWNMPPATFTLGSMLFQMEHFHLYLWLFYRQTCSPHGASSAKWFIPPPAATSTVVKGWRDGGKIYFKLSLSLGMQSTREGEI